MWASSDDTRVNWKNLFERAANVLSNANFQLAIEDVPIEIREASVRDQFNEIQPLYDSDVISAINSDSEESNSASNNYLRTETSSIGSASDLAKSSIRSRSNQNSSLNSDEDGKGSLENTLQYDSDEHLIPLIPPVNRTSEEQKRRSELMLESLIQSQTNNENQALFGNTRVDPRDFVKSTTQSIPVMARNVTGSAVVAEKAISSISGFASNQVSQSTSTYSTTNQDAPFLNRSVKLTGKCEFCGKLCDLKYGYKVHLRSCSKNPLNFKSKKA